MNLEADLEQEDENELVVEIAVQDSQVPEGFSLDTTFEEDSEEEEEEQSVSNNNKRQKKM